MSATTRSLTHQPRHVEASWPLGAGALGALVLISGVTLQGVLEPAALVLMGAVATYTLRRSWRLRGAHTSWTLEAELGLVTLVAAFFLTRWLEGLGLGAYPLLYIVLALLMAHVSPRAGLVAVGVAVGLELGTQAAGTAIGGAQPSWTPGLTRALFFAGFGALSTVVHGAQVLEQRARHKEEVEHERENLLREAREFRLIHSGRVLGAPKTGRPEDLILYDAVEAVHHTTYVSLCLLKKALDCHTCILLWLDERGERLKIKELVSDSDHLTEGSIDPARGAIGGVTRRREIVHLSDLRPGYRGLPYYREAEGVKHFLGIPILEQGHLRGVLCVDRVQDDAFEARDVDVLEETGAYILRAVQNERLFASVEKSKYELSRFFEASRRLNAALTPQEVYKEALSTLAEITTYDVAALTTYDPESGRHEIVRILGAPDFPAAREVESWTGDAFDDNAGLVSMVVKNQHYLPYGGQVRDTQPSIFGKAHRIRGLESLLVLPLVAQDVVLGTLVLGHRQANQYTQERREMLEVVGNQVAVTLQNANLYAQMEQMATRDALTGLANRRHFFDRLSETIARHRRTNKRFGVVLTDIDHFKSVNDTYGHPMGDEVLRQVARAFRETLRETDLPARYGGEEFVVILEDTDMEGCVTLANRLREAVKALTFVSEKGPFQCTISMGVALWPSDEEDMEQLIELADQALYHSKKNGRDQVTAYQSL